MSASATRLLLAMLLALPCLASCGFTGGPVSGRVVDSETGKPIPGAIVVVRWEGTAIGFAHSQSVCVHVETAVSGSDGRYRVSWWVQKPRPLVSIVGPVVDAYGSMYEAVSSQQYLHDDPYVVHMKRFTGSLQERRDYVVNRVFGSMSCHSGTSSERNMYPLLLAAYAEAKALYSPSEWEHVRPGLRELAAMAWLARPNDWPIHGPAFGQLPAERRVELQ